MSIKITLFLVDIKKFNTIKLAYLNRTGLIPQTGDRQNSSAAVMDFHQILLGKKSLYRFDLYIEAARCT